MKKTKEKTKGITLIALVITIIILLILAGISIANLTGENGILTKANDAKILTEIAEIKERAKIDIFSIQVGNKKGDITKEQLKTVLKTYFKDVPEEIPDDIADSELTAKDEFGGHKIKVADIWNGVFAKEGESNLPIFNPETLTIDTEAKNTDKYGWKVNNYTVQTSNMHTNIWRLFYQDSNYTYLITDECIGSYRPNNYYTDYLNGASVGIIGQKLNPKISSLFTTSNTNVNIRATAWLTDIEYWKSYAENDAVFAIRRSNSRIICCIL